MRQLTTMAAFAAGCLILLATISACGQPAAKLDVDSMTIEQLQDLEATVRQDMVACLEAKGWDVESDEFGYGVSDVPEEQLSRYEADDKACLTETGADQIKPPALTDERILEFREHEATTADCLRDRGFEVPSLPSEQAFVDGYRTGNPWSAYNYLPEVDEAEWNTLQTECPQL